MIRVNLLRPEKKEVVSGAKTVSYVEQSKEKKINILALVGAVVITVGTVGLLYFLQSNRLDSERKLLEDRRVRKVELEKVLAKLTEVESTKKILDSKIKIIGDLKLKQKDGVLMMDKLSASLPDWVWLTSLNFTGNVLNIDGKALSNNLIADLINNLQNSNYFTNVQLKTSVRKREAGSDVFEFKLQCQFIRPIDDANKVV
jgi:type IV pilus assembly protein PilN